MKRLEKVNTKIVNDINNRNRNGEELKQSILRDLSKSFHINSIRFVDLCDDPRNSLDDDVFIEKEKEFSSNVEHFPVSPGASGLASPDNFTFEKIEARPFSDAASHQGEDHEKSREDLKKEGRTRRASDVIDSIGDDCVNLRRSLETGGIAIATPRSRTSSDLGYSGSFTSVSSATSFSYPPPAYNFGGSKGLNDVPDSKPFTNIHEGSPGRVPEATMPVDRDADEYNMYHPRRGRAIIINNDTFDNNLANPRTGSLVDAQNLEKEFCKLGFEVTIIYNPSFHQIRESVYAISQEDHSDADCLMVAVLTHGMDNGWLFARDSLYPVDALWQPFTADKCLTLAGKPKIFFVQACRGTKVDPGVTLINRKGSVSETDAATSAYKLPSHSDFLIAYSSTDGFYSWRNTEEGTWFIQSLVEELKLNGTSVNFLDIMTRVNRRVALHFSSYNEDAPWLHEQKFTEAKRLTLQKPKPYDPVEVSVSVPVSKLTKMCCTVLYTRFVNTSV